MKIRITADFSGYPDGKTERVFRTGEEPDDLDDDYAELLVRKELAEPIDGPAKPAEPKPAPAASSPAITTAPVGGEKKDDAA